MILEKGTYRGEIMLALAKAKEPMRAFQIHELIGKGKTIHATHMALERMADRKYLSKKGSFYFISEKYLEEFENYAKMLRQCKRRKGDEKE